MMAFAQMLFLMLAWHALADGPLQGPEFGRLKLPGSSLSVDWRAALAGHGVIHGGGVAVVMMATGHGDLWWLGVAEAALHPVIDRCKGHGVFGSVADQALHALCKLAWAGIAVGWAL